MLALFFGQCGLECVGQLAHDYLVFSLRLSLTCAAASALTRAFFQAPCCSGLTMMANARLAVFDSLNADDVFIAVPLVGLKLGAPTQNRTAN